VKCCMCERPRFNATTRFCWFHARAIANLQERSVVEVANCCYADIEFCILQELVERVAAVRPKLALKLAGLLEHLDALTPDEGLQFAHFSSAEREFLRSRLEEIVTAAMGMPA
jgi:hypothetical protein